MQNKMPRDVEPLHGLVQFFGGKKMLAKHIGGIIDITPHVCYCEPFIGMGGIFFGRKKMPNVEVINDLNGDIVNIFRVVKEHCDAFTDAVSQQFYSRDEFFRLLKTPPDTMTDINRAARFYFLQKASFGGKLVGRSFSATTKRRKVVKTETMRRFFRNARRRLESVTIENLSYQEIIPRYDRSGTFFYLDPPYFGNENVYGKNLFKIDDFTIMAEKLKLIKGLFLLSINDTPEIRDIFSGFKVDQVPTTYSIRNKHTTELLFRNF